jgi:hypothetical protein
MRFRAFALNFHGLVVRSSLPCSAMIGGKRHTAVIDPQTTPSATQASGDDNPSTLPFRVKGTRFFQICGGFPSLARTVSSVAGGGGQAGPWLEADGEHK